MSDTACNAINPLSQEEWLASKEVPEEHKEWIVKLCVARQEIVDLKGALSTAMMAAHKQQDLLEGLQKELNRATRIAEDFKETIVKLEGLLTWAHRVLNQGNVRHHSTETFGKEYIDSLLKHLDDASTSR